MDIEQFKLMMEMLRGVSGDASNAAIWWMVLHYGSDFLRVLAVSGTVLGAAYFIVRAVRATQSADSLCREFAQILGVPNFDTWYGPDRKNLRAELMVALNKQANKGE